MGVTTTDWTVPRAALFDLDGTLINSEPRSLATWAKLLDVHGIPYDDDTLRSFMGRRGADVFAEKQHIFGGLDAAEIVAELRMFAADPDLPPVIHLPESVAFLKRLHAAGAPFGLVTSAGRDWAEIALSELGVLELFDCIVTAGDVEEGKPHPQGYLRGAELLGQPSEHVVVFEDTPAGIEAAKRAGMRCVGITTTHESEALYLADYVVDHLTEVDWPRIAPAPRA